MSEPRRWKDSPNAPVGMRELLGSAKPARPLDEGTFQRGAERLAKISVAPAAVAVVSVWTKLAAAGAVGLAAAGAIVAVEARLDLPAPVVAPSIVAPTAGSTRRPEATRASVDAIEPPAVVSAPEASAATPTIRSSAVQSPARRSMPTAAPASRALPVDKPAVDPTSMTATTPWVPDEPARAKSSLPGELALLEGARSHLTRSPETALARIAEHRARYPSGLLADERDLMELDALRRTGRVQDARDRAKAWLARDPNGIHAARIRGLLATLE